MADEKKAALVQTWPLTIKVFHSSGRWDRSDELLEKNVHRMRRGGRTIGTRTEISGPEHADELSWPKDGWGYWHPETSFGPANCSIEWDADEWDRTEAGFEQLTDFRPTTPKGFQLPPSCMVWVELNHLHSGLVVDVSVAHMNLHNTSARNQAWYEEAHALRKRWRRIVRHKRVKHILFQGDINRTQRLKSNQELVRRHMLAQGMRNLWVGNIPKVGGTHGRAILDATLTTMKGHSALLLDDASSDHRPYESTLRVPVLVPPRR